MKKSNIFNQFGRKSLPRTFKANLSTKHLNEEDAKKEELKRKKEEEEDSDQDEN